MKNLTYLAVLFLLSCSQVKQVQGPPGASAYDIWLSAGNKGTQQDFLNSLKTSAAPRSAFAEKVPAQVPDMINIETLGCKGDFSNDCGKILTDYVASQPVDAYINLYIPRGKFYFGTTFKIVDRMVTLSGAGRGRSVIFVEDGVDGIFINRNKGIMSECVLEKFSILALGKKKGKGSGIRVWQSSVLRELEIQGFAEYGVHVDGYIGPEESHNASFTRLNDLYIAACGKDGILLDGKDGSACSVSNIDVKNCGGYGIRDSSFLGNNFYSCMTHANKLGGFTVDHPTAAAVFVGCYTESDQPPSTFFKTVAVVGGAHFAGISWK